MGWYYIIQIVVLFLLSLSLLSLLRNKKIAAFFSPIFSLFLILELAAFVLGGRLIDYRFIEHFNVRDIFLSASNFLPQILLAIGLFIFLLFIQIRISSFFRDHKRYKVKWNVLIVCVLMTLLVLPDGIVQNLSDAISLRNAKVDSLSESLKNLGIPQEEYVRKENIRAKPGNNIIVLSLESMERSLLNDNLAHLTPMLRDIAEDYHFVPMEQMKGSDWTQGSMYTFLTGVPFFFRGNKQEVFEQASSTQLSSMSEVLNKAGYSQLYLMGKPEFAGSDKLLKLLGIEVFSEKNVAGKYPQSGWGLHDQDLFTELKNATERLHNTGKPFALYASTVSTHWPDGIYNPRMEDLVEKETSKLAFAIKSLDYLVGKYIEFLETEGILENTTIYIFPDHQFMGSIKASEIDLKDPRGLYLITNSDKIDSKDALLQIELPKLMLEGANVDHNAKFLCDFIEGDKKAFLAANRANLLSLNEAALEGFAFGGDITIEINEAHEVVVKSSTNELMVEKLTKENPQSVNLVFDDRMRIKLKYASPQINFAHPPKGKHIFLSRSNDELTAYLRFGKNTYSFQQSSGALSFSKEMMSQVDSAVLFESNLFSDYPNQLQFSQIDPNQSVKIMSSSHQTAEKTYRSQITAGERIFNLRRGLNLLTYEDGIYQLKNYDTFADSTAIDPLYNRLEELVKNRTYFTLVADIDAGNLLSQYSLPLTKLGFTKLAKLKSKQAYIGYCQQGVVLEQLNDRFLTLTIPYHPVARRRSSNEVATNAKDPSRFIAHAGGVVEGVLYTNSLEALDHSYKKGFRLFELDIVKTSDGHFVATHDWRTWKKQTGYQGPVPVRLETFKQQKIEGRYTPLDLESINKWFEKHPDAILVTDKVNSPALFSSQFIDKNRLMMELFSLDALEEATALGIRSAIPSMNVLNAISGDKIQYLKDRKITDVAVSIDLLYRVMSFYKRLQDHGIRTYIFHINRSPWLDEKHALLFEMDYVYGLYADDWDFNL